MHIKGLQKTLYKIAHEARTQELLEPHQRRYEEPIKQWLLLPSQNVSDTVIHKIMGKP